MVNGDFWKGKRVFVTGHTGFKGSWLSLWLHMLGAELSGYALHPHTDPSLFHLLNLSSLFPSREGDVRDFPTLHESIRTCRPEIVIHMAAQAIVRRSYMDPLNTYATNVMGTVNLLEAVRRTDDIRAVIIVTSDKCYENRESIWGYRETDPLGGFDPYAGSKGCAELVTASYRRSFFTASEQGQAGTAIASVRAGNVIGGGDWAEDRLIPDIIRSFSTGKSVLIRSPKAIRPWQHVLDPLSGYLLLAEKLYQNGSEFAHAWNFGPADDDAKPVSWIVEYMASLWGNGACCEIDMNTYPHDHPREATWLKLDCTKARTIMGWKPKLNIDQALQWSINWYRHYYREPGSAYDITMKQLNDFASYSP